MKKSLRFAMIITLVLMIALSGMSTAFAADYAPQFTPLADQLKAMGLFQGTDKGYELERAATRTEASVMLVRLLGKEAEALAGTYEIPFTDVATWAKPYVGYMYEAGLTKGVSEDKFGSDTLCDVKMYSTFVLRSLGYSDTDGDFTYVDSADFAITKGIIDPSLTEGTFLRDQVAAVSYNAMGAQVKGTENCLIQKLVSDGAITADAAKPMLDKIAVFADFEKVNAAYGNMNSANIDATVAGKISVTIDGQKADIPMDMTFKTMLVGKELQFASTEKKTVSGQAITASTYFKDGYTYVDDGTTKIKVKNAEATAAFNLEDYMKMGTPLYMFDSITKTTSGTNTVFNMTFADAALNGMVSDIADSMPITDESPTFTAYSLSLEVDKDNIIKSMKANITMTSENMDMVVEMTVKVNAIGDKVTITFPDFKDYVEAAPADDADKTVTETEETV